MKEKLKACLKKWWEQDDDVLDTPEFYGSPLWIIVQVLVIAVFLCLLYAWAKDFQVTFDRKELIISLILAVNVMAFVYVYIQLSKSVAERKVFTQRNARLFMRLGHVMNMLDAILFPLLMDSDRLWVIVLLLFPVLGAMALQMAGWMINKGIQMQEEQDLTI